MNIVAIIQARMGSTRLPGKVLMDLAGEPMLARVMNRARRASSLGKLVVATTTENLDEAILELCRGRGWLWARGSQDDVLDRYYRAASAYGADIVVRITSDCPLIDPEVIDLVVHEFIEHQPLDYATNSLEPRTFPRGLDTEVIAFDALARAWKEDRDPAWREHVTPYLYRHPEVFRVHVVASEQDRSSMRWTVDTPEDLEFVRRIYGHFGHDRFSWREVLSLLETHPEWLDINRHIRQREI